MYLTDADRLCCSKLLLFLIFSKHIHSTINYFLKEQAKSCLHTRALVKNKSEKLEKQKR